MFSTTLGCHLSLLTNLVNIDLEQLVHHSRIPDRLGYIFDILDLFLASRYNPRLAADDCDASQQHEGKGLSAAESAEGMDGSQTSC